MMNMMPIATNGSQLMQGRTGAANGQPAGDFLPFLQQAQGEGLSWNGHEASQDLMAALLAAGMGVVPASMPHEGFAPAALQGQQFLGDGSMLPGQDLLAMEGQQNPDFLSGQDLKAAAATAQSQGKMAEVNGANMSAQGDLLDQEAEFDLKMFMAKTEGGSAQASAGEGKGSTSLSESRFAEILGVKSVEVKSDTIGPNKEAAGHSQLRLAQNGQIEESVAEPTLSVDATADEAGEVPELSLGHKATIAGETDGFTHKGQDALQVDSGRPSQAPATGLENKGPEVRLNSGMLISENRIVEQTIEKFSLHQAKDAGSITLRLHPEELGQIKVELVMDKDSVRAHLHAQSQQVQEVLERHLPRLRDALEQQGLKIDQLQVSVDSQHNGNRGSFQQHGFTGHQNMPATLAGYKGTPAEVPPSAQPIARQGSGLSLRI
ncbi:flagellar hook-length control protein FliK [Desulfuromonas sp. AOP6]|uniref:flagellar hook-length control protein FliK n=1 Tax=Desulfuromonas sp. AOP6 TaxID=1566351 RepID=UPI001283B883|nr:flagellar hook-length control protein FliK [Desulfuromonas sp. AOP6]BCA79112.1 hypothetical protein AOP6_0899 [Desulfuromonas sp. AOP6]